MKRLHTNTKKSNPKDEIKTAPIDGPKVLGQLELPIHQTLLKQS
jgi:hypothetical protein